jgi:hypothetical protein
MSRSKVGFGIDYLDNAMEGGVPEGSVILLASGDRCCSDLISLSFLNEGIINGEIVLFAEFRTTPLHNLLKAASRHTPIASLIRTDEPVFLNLEGGGDLELLTELAESSGVSRLVLSHPEVLRFREGQLFFPLMEEVLKNLRILGITTLISSDLNEGSPFRFVSDVNLEVENAGDGKLKLNVLQWPCGGGDDLDGLWEDDGWVS